MIKFKNPDTYYLINDKLYINRKEIVNTESLSILIGLTSLDEIMYPSIKVSPNDIEYAFRTSIVTKCLNYDSIIVHEILKNSIIIKLPYGHPLIEEIKTTLDSKGYWHYASIDRSSDMKFWELRYPVDSYKFPTDMKLAEEIVI